MRTDYQGLEDFFFVRYFFVYYRCRAPVFQYGPQHSSLNISHPSGQAGGKTLSLATGAFFMKTMGVVQHKNVSGIYK